MNVQELARQGRNIRCVECSGSPLFGGMRCLTCFKALAEKRRFKTVTPHTCGKHQPAVVCYIKCRCRCVECQTAMRDYKKSRP